MKRGAAKRGAIPALKMVTAARKMRARSLNFALQTRQMTVLMLLVCLLQWVLRNTMAGGQM
eukprot:5286816-Pleurochrysis_carterae.AAC.1